MKCAKKCFLYLLLNLIFSTFLHAGSESGSLIISENKETKFDVLDLLNNALLMS